MSDILRRSVPTTLARVDRSTLECRFVPFDVTAIAVDPLPDGTLDRYKEAFAPTVFDRQLKAAEKQVGVFQRITAVDEHGGSKIGFTTALRRESDGLYGSVRLLPSRIDDVEALLDEGVNNLSVEFIALRGGTKHLDDGTRLRTAGHLVRVALVSQGAYEGAEVLAMRDAEDAVVAADREYQDEMADLDEYLARAMETQAKWNERIGSAPATG